jgi:hypothetical protein
VSLKIFFCKKIVKKVAYFAQNTASFYKILSITLTFEKKAIFVAENWRKIAKNVVILPGIGFFNGLLTSCNLYNLLST